MVGDDADQELIQTCAGFRRRDPDLETGWLVIHDITLLIDRGSDLGNL